MISDWYLHGHPIDCLGSVCNPESSRWEECPQRQSPARTGRRYGRIGFLRADIHELPNVAKFVEGRRHSLLQVTRNYVRNL